ncbi:hypothetical protein M885DRAFT_529693 [Pelagophyceae sp. CCMP2097]|nr:hypothetical protein M885DRAFT_529693 [Pelagophyceae sp. CCMP2097]
MPPMALGAWRAISFTDARKPPSPTTVRSAAIVELAKRTAETAGEIANQLAEAADLAAIAADLAETDDAATQSAKSTNARAESVATRLVAQTRRAMLSLQLDLLAQAEGLRVKAKQLGQKDGLEVRHAWSYAEELRSPVKHRLRNSAALRMPVPGARRGPPRLDCAPRGRRLNLCLCRLGRAVAACGDLCVSKRRSRGLGREAGAPGAPQPRTCKRHRLGAPLSIICDAQIAPRRS